VQAPESPNREGRVYLDSGFFSIQGTWADLANVGRRNKNVFEESEFIAARIGCYVGQRGGKVIYGANFSE